MMTALSVRFEYSGSQGSVSGLFRAWRSKPSGMSDVVMSGSRVDDIAAIERNARAKSLPTKF
jgi:hypothetical protein